MMGMEDNEPIIESIKKLKAIGSKVGEKYKEDITDIIEALKMAAGVEADDEEMDSEEDSPKKSIIIASLKKKFKPMEDEYGE